MAEGVSLGSRQRDRVPHDRDLGRGEGGEGGGRGEAEGREV